MRNATRIWHCGRETICYRDANLACQFGCYFSSESGSWTVHINDECVDDGKRRRLTQQELAEILPRVEAFLRHRRFLGLPVGHYDVHVIRSEGVA